MIRPLADAGHRVLAPDLIGFGRSDKPTRAGDYTYLRHVEWVPSWLTTLDLRDATAVVQDWGSLIGLRVAAENPDRFGKLFIANGCLPTGDRPTPAVFRIWRAVAKHTPWFNAGRLVDFGTVHKLLAAVRAGYDANTPAATPATSSRRTPAASWPGAC